MNICNDLYFFIFVKIKYLNAEWIAYLKRENISNYEQIKNFYMPRRLKRFIQISRKILDENNTEKQTKEKNFLIVHTAEEFREKCLSYHQSPTSKSIHYLKYDEKHQNFVWQRSMGPISSLNEYILKQDEFCHILLEEQILNEYESILIIAAEPGMGKSAILDKLTQYSHSFFIKIILNTCTQAFREPCDFDKNDAIDFTLKSLMTKRDDLEIALLKHLAREEKLILMFDGVDEVSDCKEQVKTLIKVLSKNSKLKKILLTTRNHLKPELEGYFETISFNLSNFEESDQKCFLYKYWRNLTKKHQERATSARLHASAEELISKLKSITNITQLIGIPLQTNMIADIYFENAVNVKTSTRDDKIIIGLSKK
jgi:hypothetical protein